MVSKSRIRGARREELSGLEGLLAIVSLEVTTEGIRTGRVEWSLDSCSRRRTRCRVTHNTAGQWYSTLTSAASTVCWNMYGEMEGESSNF